MRKPKPSGRVAEPAHLVDTAALLWALGAPERLSRAARDRIQRGTNVVSVASYWEVVIKTGKGLLTISDLPTWWQRSTDAVGARVLSIRASHISRLADLPLHHKDPFDRILIAQAMVEKLAIVTNDEHIGRYAIETLW